MEEVLQNVTNDAASWIIAVFTALASSGALGAITVSIVKSLFNKVAAKVQSAPIAQEVIKCLQDKDFVVKITPIVEAEINKEFDAFTKEFRAFITEKVAIDQEKNNEMTKTIAHYLAEQALAYSTSKAFSEEERAKFMESYKNLTDLCGCEKHEEIVTTALISVGKKEEPEEEKTAAVDPKKVTFGG